MNDPCHLSGSHDSCKLIDMYVCAVTIIVRDACVLCLLVVQTPCLSKRATDVQVHRPSVLQNRIKLKIEVEPSDCPVGYRVGRSSIDILLILQRQERQKKLRARQSSYLLISVKPLPVSHMIIYSPPPLQWGFLNIPQPFTKTTHRSSFLKLKKFNNISRFTC